jgi:hypothetical protein
MNIIAALNEEASKLESRLSAVRAAIDALNGASGRKNANVETSKPRRSMSAAGRRRIIEASKRRWAKYRAEKNGNAQARRVMSAATKRKLLVAAKARWAARSK